MSSTKCGAACEVARRIADKIDEETVYDLKQADVPSLAELDCVIIGSSLYAGLIRKKAKAFLLKNVDMLRGKRIGLFLSGMDIDTERQKSSFEKNLLPELLQSVKATCTPSGIYDPKKAGRFERIIFKLATKQSAYSDNIDDGKIAYLLRR